MAGGTQGITDRWNDFSGKVRHYASGKGKPWIVKAVSTYDWRDKTVKLAVEFTKFVQWVGPMAGMSKEALEGSKSFEKGLGDARAVFGLVNVFGSVLFDLTEAVTKAVSLLLNMRAKDAVFNKASLLTDKDGRRGMAQNTDKYPTLAARMLGFVTEIGRVSEKICFTICFAVCNPIRYAAQHFPNHISEDTKAFGKEFPTFWMAFHVSGLVANVSDFVREGIVLYKQKAKSAALESLWDRIGTLSFKLYEGVTDIANDVIHIFEVPVAQPVKVVLGLSNAIVGFVRVNIEAAAG